MCVRESMCVCLPAPRQARFYVLTLVSVPFRVDLWNASNLKFGDEFLGGVRVPLRVLGQAGTHDAW